MHSDKEYINTDPFEERDTVIKCRTVIIRTARKSHTCFGLDGKMDHSIFVGMRYRYEKALIDNEYWGEYKMCLNCMDKFLKEFEC